MRLRHRLTTTAILLSGALALTGCSATARGPEINLPQYLRTPAANPSKPTLPKVSDQPLRNTPADERRFIWDTYVRPLMNYSIGLAEGKAAETARAKGLEGVIDQANEAARPRSFLDHFRRKR